VSLGLLKKRAGNISAHPGLTAVAQEMLPTIEVVGSCPVWGSEIDIDNVPSDVMTGGAAAFSHTNTPDLEKRSSCRAGVGGKRGPERQFCGLRDRRVHCMYMDLGHQATRPSLTSTSQQQATGRCCGYPLQLLDQPATNFKLTDTFSMRGIGYSP
jgi:hypothetical protein